MTRASPSSPTGPRRRRAWTLRAKVSIALSLGLLVVLATWTAVSYASVREVALEAGVQRLEAVASQFAGIYRRSARETTRSMRTTAANPEIVAFFRGGATAADEALRAVLARAVAGATQRVDLLGTDGVPRFSFPERESNDEIARDADLAAAVVQAARGPDHVGFTPLRVVDAGVAVAVVAGVLVEEEVAGYAVVWRHLPAVPEMRQRLSGLVGSDARLHFGNARGDVWTELGGDVHRFPIALRIGGPVLEYAQEDGTRVLAATRPVEESPWAVAVEFSEAEILASPKRFLTRSVALGSLLLAIGAAAAWLLSRRVTRPLRELTEAATAVASGEYSRTVDVRRGDEIGRLAAAFNAMAARIGEAHEALEVRVKERTEQLQQRNEELEAFSRSVSHDLRAPLRAMQGFSQALLEDCGEQLDETGKGYARRIAAAALRMDVLTQDLLSYSRVARSEVAVTPVDLGAVARDVVTMLEKDISAGGGRVTLHEPLPAVMGHRPLVEQSLANLLSNGLKFVPPGRAPDVSVRAEISPGWVRVWVEDNGIGIDPAQHERIFAPFERLHRPDEYPGTGIGLAIVRKAVERMGGREGVESAPGAGSRFWIELPAIDTRETAAVPQQ